MESGDSAASSFESPKKPLWIQSYFKNLKFILLEHKPYFIGMMCAFFAAVLFGYFLAPTLSDSEFFATILDSFKNMEDKTSFELFIMIFLNNSFVAFLLIIFGFFFGIVSLLIIFINGTFIGIILEYVLKEQSLLFFLAGTMPHGIIEIPIFLLSGAVGFRFGVRVLLYLLGKISFSDVKKDFSNSLWIYFLFVIPMLFAAAFIESYVTSYLLEVFF